MFFLFIFITLFIIAGIAIHTSRIGIDIENLIIDTEQPKGKTINEESKIYVYLLLFGKVKLLKKNVRTINKEDLKFKKPNFKINYIELVKNIDIDVEQIDLYIQLGTQDAASTAILVGTIAVILGIILKKPKYQVIPDYLNKNFLKIKLNCIFSIYLMQYIYKLILERKKRGIIRSKRWRR